MATGGTTRRGWTADSLDPRWVRPFTDDELASLDHALSVFKRSVPSLDPGAMTDDNFPLMADPRFRAEIASLQRRLVDGDGVVVYEGFPVERYELDELRAVWWGLARAIGRPVVQSRRGDLIGDVRDLGTGISGPVGRGYTSNTELNFHSDASDAGGLFFLRTSKEGGVSRVASSVTTHDVIAERRPDLLAELYRPMPWSWQGNEEVGERPWYEMPVFGMIGDDVSCSYVRTNILLAHENTGAPQLTDAQREAVQMVADVAAEPGMWVERQFEPGTMFWFHNHTVLHLRTAFVDWDDPARRRHLLRVWFSPPNSRPLPDSFASFFGDVSPGAFRQGYHSGVDHPVYETF